MGELVKLQQEGKIRQIDLSDVETDQIIPARKIASIDTVKNRYNLIDRSSENVLEYCAKENIGFIPWFPISTGTLAQPGGPLDKLVLEFGATPAQLAIDWLLHRSSVMLASPGTSSITHLEENLAAINIRLSDDQCTSRCKAI